MKQLIKFGLSKRDWIQGLLMAILGAAWGVAGPSIEQGNFTLDWPSIWHATIAAIGAYMTKQLFRDNVQAAKKTIEVHEKKMIDKIYKA